MREQHLLQLEKMNVRAFLIKEVSYFFLQILCLWTATDTMLPLFLHRVLLVELILHIALTTLEIKQKQLYTHVQFKA